MIETSITKWIKKKIRRLIGIVEDGDTATHSIAAGKYVVWKGNLCKASTAIAIGTALSSSNLTAVNDGGLNDINGNLATKTATITGSGSWSFNNPVKKVADIVTFIGYATSTTALQVNSWTALGTLPEGYRPSVSGYYVPGYDNTNDSAVIVRIASNGVVDVYSKTAAKTIAVNFTFCV